MQATSSLLTKIGPGDASSAVAALTRALTDHAQVTADSRLTAWIDQESPAPALRQLASVLPPATVGFIGGRSGSAEMSAADFLTRAHSWKKAGFSGTLAHGKDVLPTLTRLRDAWTGAEPWLQLSVEPLRWKGDRDGWTGSIACDSTSKRSRSHQLQFISECVDVPDEDAARDVWKSIRSRTGLDFLRKATFCDVQPDADSTFATDVCFREAILDAQQALFDQGVRVEHVKGAMDVMQALQTRIETWGTGASQRVPFDRIVKDTVLRELPDYVFRERETEATRFGKPLTPSIELALRVDKIHFHGLGKTFQLMVGAYATSARFHRPLWEADAFTLLGLGGGHCWTYQTTADLEQMLVSMTRFVRAIDPPLSAALAKWLPQIPAQIPPEVPRRPSLSARTAFAQAAPLARQWRSDAELVEVQGARIDSTGLATPHGQWSLWFRDPAAWTKRSLVAIFATGRPQRLEITTPGEVVPVPALTRWIDSSEAWPLLRKAAEKALGPGASSEGNISQAWKSPGYDPPRWHLRFTPEGSDRSIGLSLNALDGTEIHIDSR